MNRAKIENVALDIGNTRCKFSREAAPESVGSLDFRDAAFFERLDELFAKDANPVHFWISSVNRAGLERFLEWERSGNVTVLTADTLPIRTAVEERNRVGVDRLLAAVTANALRTPGHPAVWVDLGTCLKVDAVDDSGTFLGGAIAPGLRMSAIALEKQTDALPQLDVEPLLTGTLEAEISSLGRNTHDALLAGLYWGMVGTVRELVAQTAKRFSNTPDFFLTGGGAANLRAALGDHFRYVDEMVIRGLWTTIRERT